MASEMVFDLFGAMAVQSQGGQISAGIIAEV